MAATLGKDRVEVTPSEHFLCSSRPRLCACSFSCLTSHSHLEWKLQEGETRTFSLPRNPQPWEQSLVPGGPSTTTCQMHVIFTEALQGLCYHSHLQEADASRSGITLSGLTVNENQDLSRDLCSSEGHAHCVMQPVPPLRNTVL